MKRMFLTRRQAWLKIAAMHENGYMGGLFYALYYLRHTGKISVSCCEMMCAQIRAYRKRHFPRCMFFWKFTRADVLRRARLARTFASKKVKQ